MEKNIEIRSMIIDFKNGNKDVFPEILQIVKNDVYRIIYAITRNETIALDVFDEVMYKAYTNLDNLIQIEFFKTWIIRIAINEANANMKKNLKVVNLDDYIENIPDKPNNIEESMDLEKCIGKLEANIKEVIILKCYMNYTFEEIGNMLEKPVNTIKTWYYKGIEQLRQEMISKGGELYE